MQPVSTALTGAIEAISQTVENQTGTAISGATSEELRMYGELVALADLSTPDEVDSALVGLLTSQLGLSVALDMRRDWTGQRPFLRKVADLSIRSPSREATKQALKLLSIAEQPALDEEVMGWLAILRTLVRAPNNSEFEAELVLRAYCDKLREFPADIVRHVLAAWPDQSEWWPTWIDLKQALSDASTPRRTMIFHASKLLHT